MGAHVIEDFTWGDNGKGLSSAWVGKILGALATVRGCGGMNPEHGIFVGDYYLKVNQLPLGWILQESTILIGPGTAVNVKRLFEEMTRFRLNPDKMRIDFRCPIITQENIDEERQSSHMINIGGTFSGTGIAMAHAARRIAPIAQDIEALKPYLDDVPQIANEMAVQGDIVLESTQGTFLSRYHGEYPNVTSVDVTTPSVVAGAGLNWRLVEDVYLCVKTLPTREGTGSLGDVEEFTVEEMEKLGIIEYSSIDDPETGKKKIRRKAKSIDFNLLKRSVMLNGANKIALTFAEHYDREVEDVTKWVDITPKVRKLIEKVEKETGVEVTLINTGKQFTSMVSKNDDLPEVTDEMMQRIKSYI